jgi:subfamily B ATP-binding cassette protein MsbA
VRPTIGRVKDHTKKGRSRQAFWRACGFLWPYRVEVGISIASAFAAGLLFTFGLSAMIPIVKILVNDHQTVQQVVEQSVAAAQAKGQVPWYLNVARDAAAYLPTRPFWTIVVMFGVISALAMVGNVFRFFHEYLSDKSAVSAVADIRKKLYDHTLHLPLPYFGRHGTSDVTSRLVSDAQGLHDGFKTILGPAVAEPIKAAFTLILASLYSWQLTLFIILFAPLMAAVIKKFGTKVRRASRAAMESSAGMLGQIEGTLVGIRVVKSATAERFERRRYGSIMDDLCREHVKMARYQAFSTPTLETLGMLAVGCVLLLASYLMFETQSNVLTPTGFLIVLACLVSIGESLRKMSKLNTVIQRSNAAGSRIFELLDLPIERPKHLPAGEKLVHMRGLERAITFDGLSFTYPNTDHPAVDNVTLTIKKGQSTAIVGRNGSGKTTLLSLLPRFFEPSSGTILIDGVDVRRLTLKSLRENIAIVTQDAVVFPGTIAENIAYGHPSVPLLLRAPDSAPAKALRQQIEAAAAEAFAHDFIMQKPNGYDTRLDGLGAQLSGGQKQRLNIARAILRSAPILILDEATSQVDAESEHLIQNAIERLMQERTTFVIAHRFSTILAADTIVVMEAGRIVGQGKHDELMRDCPTYSGLYERQLMPA